MRCLNRLSYLGHSDWRLPNRKEIRSLVDYSRQPPPFPPGNPFTGMMAGFWDFYWSSTTNPGQLKEAWIMYGASGGVINGDKANSNWAWPVRAGAASDLVCDGSVVPQTAGAGQALTVADTIRNTGAGTAGPSTTKFYLSTDEAYDAGDLHLGSRDVPSLAGGASDSGSTAVTIPSSTGAGTYHVLIRADANAVVPEASETNNDTSRILRVGPDLVSEGEVAPPLSCTGQALRVADTIRNTGGDTAGPSTTRFYLSTDEAYDAGDVHLGSRHVPSLAAGWSDTGSTMVPLPSATGAGTYYVLVRADADAAVSEASEANNGTSRMIRVGPDPDLVITNLSMPSYCAGRALVGFVEVAVKNQGGCPAGRSIIKFYASRNPDLDASDIYLGYSQPVPYLASGASATRKISVTVPPSIPAGTYYVIAYVDAYHSVSEADEGNNARSRRVEIKRCR